MAKKSTTKTNATVSLNVHELKDFLKHIIDNNRYLQENNKPMVSTEVVGVIVAYLSKSVAFTESFSPDTRLVVPTSKFPLASRVIAWVKVMALPAVPLGALNH